MRKVRHLENMDCGNVLKKKLCEGDCETCYERSLASYYNEKLGIFPKDYVEGDVDPRRIPGKSRILISFRCNLPNCQHVFFITANTCTEGHWCPFCTSKRLCEDENCQICFEKSLASFYNDLLEIYPRDYWAAIEKTPRQVLRCSGKHFDFSCHMCAHIFSLRISDCVLRNYWCPYCSGKTLCSDSECQICFENSFASCERSKQWNYKMNDTVPRKIRKRTHKKYFFDCEKCQHTFQSSPDSISGGSWCPFCKGAKLCENYDCEICISKSFAFHEKSVFWSKKNILEPWQVRIGSNKKFWFVCDICDHTFISKLDNITINGNWCPYCSNPPKKLCPKEKNCGMCFEKSFASHEKVRYMAPGQKLDLSQIFKSGHRPLIKFICDVKTCKKEFSLTPNKIVSSGNWCPSCKKKTERKFEKYLLKTLPENTEIIHQAKFDWCKNPETDRHYLYDFYIPSLRLIVEIDGPQHFQQVHNWTCPVEIQKTDLYKEQRATQHDIRIIRLLQTDIYFDTHKWEEIFEKYVNGTTPVVKIYEGQII